MRRRGARLKLQNPRSVVAGDICDNLYYLFIVRSLTMDWSDPQQPKLPGMGWCPGFWCNREFLTTGLQRHQLASAHPEQYLKYGTTKLTIAVRILSCTWAAY